MIYIIADDLTGASDSGIQLAKNGFSTFVAIDSEMIDLNQQECEVLSINANSRAKKPIEAKKIIKELVFKIKKQDSTGLIYKKIDSLFRGNTVVEIESLIDAGNYDTAYVAATYPSGNRQMIDGKIINSRYEIDVNEIFEQDSKKKFKLISLSSVRKGKKYLIDKIEHLKTKGYQIFVFDGETDDDLDLVYQISILGKEKNVLCGSAGLIDCIREKKITTFRNYNSNEVETTFFAIGSQNEVTRNQVRYFLEKNSNINHVMLDTEQLLGGDFEGEIDRAVKMFIDSPPSPQYMLSTDSLFQENEFSLKVSESMEQRSQIVLNAIHRVIERINQKIKISCIVATGGDTALEICSTFNARGIRLENEVLPGIPVGVLVDGTMDGTRIITKSGGFGKIQTLDNIKNYIETIKGVEQNVN